MPTMLIPEKTKPVRQVAVPRGREPARVQCEFLTRENEPAYQEYVDRHPEATLFHGLEWGNAVQATFKHRPFYVVARREAKIVGVLPLFEIKGLLGSRFMMSMPYATYGGVLSDDSKAAANLIDIARQLAKARSASCIELRSVHASDPSSPLRHTHATFRRELPDRPEAVLEMIPRKARAAARRAEERYGLEVEFGDHGLKALWRHYARSMRRLGSPNYPLRFFRALIAKTDHCVQIVRYRKRPVAGLLTFFHRATAMPYFIGLDERRDIYGLSNFVYWQSMMDAVQRGCRIYDFGRTRIDNTGPFEFKRSFGFEPKMLEYQTIVMPGKRAPDLSPASPRWSAARMIWKNLPLMITKPLGSRIARSIPG